MKEKITEYLKTFLDKFAALIIVILIMSQIHIYFQQQDNFKSFQKETKEKLLNTFYYEEFIKIKYKHLKNDIYNKLVIKISNDDKITREEFVELLNADWLIQQELNKKKLN